MTHALVVAKLDRLARNVHFLSGLMESGVEFHACDTPGANRFTIHVLAAVAENEAQAISARTKAALAAAKARGTVLGGDRGNLTDALRRRARKNSAKARQHQAVKHASDLMPIIEQLRGEGATSLRQIAATLTEHGIPAPRGGEWQSRAGAARACSRWETRVAIRRKLITSKPAERSAGVFVHW